MLTHYSVRCTLIAGKEFQPFSGAQMKRYSMIRKWNGLAVLLHKMSIVETEFAPHQAQNFNVPKMVRTAQNIRIETIVQVC